MKNVFFEPWIGANYQSGGIFGKKILVLGESLYCGGCDGCKTSGMSKAEEFLSGGCHTTKKAVSKYLSKPDGWDYWHNTYLKFERSLVGKETDQELKEQIWDSVIFYNFLQVALTESRKAGEAEDYKDAAIPFFEVLEEYRPEKVIVWGKQLWQRMPGGTLWTELPKIKIDGYSERVGSYKLQDGSDVKVMAVYHPSVGYSWDYWHKIITAFIAM